MKKNAVGHMTMRKESATSFLRRANVIPKLLCLLSALLIWLLIVNLMPTDQSTGTDEATHQMQIVVPAVFEF